MRPGAYERQRAALGVVHAAMKQHGPLPVALVQALEDAQLLQSPEVAAELDEYRRSLSLLVIENAALADQVCACGAAAEQRHQYLDPSELPVTAFIAPVVDVAPALAVGGAPC